MSRACEALGYAALTESRAHELEGELSACASVAARAAEEKKHGWRMPELEAFAQTNQDGRTIYQCVQGRRAWAILEEGSEATKRAQ